MNKFLFFKISAFFLSMIVTLQVSAQPPITEWVRQIGGINHEYGSAICSDSKGNVYSTGCFEGNADFDPGSGNMILTSNGQFDIFISKLDAIGNFVWAKQIGISGSSINKGYDIKADTFGNIYVVGQFEGSPDFNPGSGVNRLTAFRNTDAFILKLDSLGEFVWAKNLGSLGGNGTNIAYGMELDAFGNIYVTGEASTNIFVSKLNSSGNFLWTKTMGGTRSEYGFAVGVDDSGNVYTTGHFSSNIVDFDPGMGTFNLTNAVQNSSSYSYDVFLSKLDSLGNFVWAKTIAGGADEYGRGLAVDPAGYVYTSGLFRGTINANSAGTPFYLTSFGFENGFICKFKTSGDFVWAKQIGGTRSTLSYGLALDSDGGVYSTGSFSGTVDFNPGLGAMNTFNLNARGGLDIYISKLDSSGNFSWAKSFPGTLNKYSYSNGIATDHNKTVYAIGYFNGDVSFDTTINNAQLQSFGNSDDAFLIKINQFCLDSSFNTLEVTVCDSIYKFNEKTYNVSGAYLHTFKNKAGCDSTVALNLTLNTIQHPVISVDVFILKSAFQYASYQWMLNGYKMTGETDSFITVTENGDYRVIVTNENDCIDTSDIYQVTNVSSISKSEENRSKIKIYPNPTEDIIYINSKMPLRFAITNVLGSVLKEGIDVHSISVKELASGMYLLRISDLSGRFLTIEKIFKK